MLSGFRLRKIRYRTVRIPSDTILGITNCYILEKLHWNVNELTKYKNDFKRKEPNILGISQSWSKTCPDIICHKIVDGTHKTPNYKTEGIPFLSAKNIKDWRVDYDDCKFISLEEHVELIRRCNPQKGSLLLTKSGTIGRMAILDHNPDFSLFESVAVLTPLTSRIKPEFLGFSISVYLNDEGMEKHIKGTAVQHLHLNEIRLLPIYLPSELEQQEIVRRVEFMFAKADQIEASYQKLKVKLEQLPQALLAKAFRGELVEQLPTDGDARDLLEQIKKAKAGLENGGKSKKLGKEEPVRMVAEDGVRYGKK
jgi:type I restriction enzyme, S subunit